MWQKAKAMESKPISRLEYLGLQRPQQNQNMRSKHKGLKRNAFESKQAIQRWLSL